MIDFGCSLADHLPLIKFAYKNSYHSSIGIALFEALYSRRCRSYIELFKVFKAGLFGPELVHQAMEKVNAIS